MDAPWSNKETLSTKDRMERLSKEILDFEKYIEPTKEEELNRNTLLYQITQLVTTIWPNSTTITSFGSSVTGLAFPASDIDINIDFEELPKKNVVDILKIIRRKSVDAGIFRFSNTNLAARAKVPVLMATDENNVSIDISIQNVCYSSDRTVTWIKEYPALKPLFMVLKQAIGNFRLTDVPTFEPLSAKFAGLASYSLVCLIVSYLQLQVPKDMNSSKKEYYGTILTGFLNFYSKFDTSRQAIGFEDGGKYYSAQDCPITLETKPGKLTIVDPDVPDTNVARSTLKFDRLKLIFANASKLILNRMNESSKTESILSSLIKVENHYHGEPRSQGLRFKASYLWIENGSPQKHPKNFNRRHNMPYDKNQSRSYQRYEDNRSNEYSRYENTTNSYRNPNRYDQPDDYNQREYQRHKRNNNTHLAQHYKRKADCYRR